MFRNTEQVMRGHLRRELLKGQEAMAARFLEATVKMEKVELL